jgi:Type I phosphodiesterase / nucleotide pyrophosphatase
MKVSALLIGLIFLTFLTSAQQPTKTKNLILVTIDGLRWQEVFRGADKNLINSEFTANKGDIKTSYWKESLEERRKALFPFLWTVLASQGQLYGNRDIGNKQEVSNRFRFSYPGYNEILTGFADKMIHSNAKEYNSNGNVLEYINQQNEFEGKVAAFTSWDVFPYILNDKRSAVPVNSGISDFKEHKTDHFSFLNQIQKQMLSPVGESIRPDVLTYQFGKTYLMVNKPKVLFLAFDETDDYAHSGYYHFYLRAANKTDQVLADLWEYIQSDPFYKDQTTLIITSDHGRGDSSPSSWKNHGSMTRNSEQTWIAVVGPDTPSQGEMGKNEKVIYHNQLAQTISEFLGLDFKSTALNPIGRAINSMFNKQAPKISAAYQP